MSELEDRWFWAYPTESVDSDGITGSANEVYSKSEADAVIAEKDKEIAELEERISDDDKDFEMANSQNERLLKIVRHHKYKRCLAMARWFKIMSILAADYRVPREKWNFYEKWHNRWLELSEKFKEAK